jgi:two-component system phosphate regulon sensor histidine kinase PhoR
MSGPPAKPAFGIRLKLFVACLALTVSSAAVIQAVATRRLDREFLQRIRDSLLVRLAFVAHESSLAGLRPQERHGWDELADQLGARAHARVTLLGPDGVVLGDSELSGPALAQAGNHLARPEVAEALSVGKGFSERRSPTLAHRMMYVAVPMKRGESLLGVARLALPLKEIDATLAGVGRTVSYGSAVALALGTALALGAAQVLSRRTRQLTDAALRMAEGKLETRADGVGRDELAALGRALNEIVSSHSRSASDAREQRRFLEQVLEAMGEGVLVVDAGGRVVLVNSALREMLLLSSEVGEPVLEVVRDPGLARFLSAAATGTASGELEVAGLKPRRLFVDAGPLPDRAGGVVAVFVDLTDASRLETAQQDFAASVSQQLRKPLAAMAQAAQRLQLEPVDEAGWRGAVEAIDRNGRRLQHLVEDILQLSRVRGQEFHLELKVEDLSRVVERLFAQLEDQAAGKRLHLVADIPPTLGYVVADRQALEHVLSHLLDNTLKDCSPDATILVRASPEGRWARISIEGGRGVDAQRMLRLLERRGGGQRDPDDASSVGLGLSMVKHLTEAMKGRVMVETAPGKAGVITLALPRA